MCVLSRGNQGLDYNTVRRNKDQVRTTISTGVFLRRDILGLCFVFCRGSSPVFGVGGVAEVHYTHHGLQNVEYGTPQKHRPTPDNKLHAWRATDSIHMRSNLLSGIYGNRSSMRTTPQGDRQRVRWIGPYV